MVSAAAAGAAAGAAAQANPNASASSASSLGRHGSTSTDESGTRGLLHLNHLAAANNQASDAASSSASSSSRGSVTIDTTLTSPSAAAAAAAAAAAQAPASATVAPSPASTAPTPPSAHSASDPLAAGSPIAVGSGHASPFSTVEDDRTGTASGATTLASTATGVQYRAKAQGPRKPWVRPNSTPYGAVGLPQASAASTLSSTTYGLHPRATASGAATSTSAVLKAAKGVYDDGDEHDPARWHFEGKEPDDALHDPEEQGPPAASRLAVSTRACSNVGTLAVLIAAVLMLFMGYPLISHYSAQRASKQGGFNIGGTNGTGQLPDYATFGLRSNLTDPDTPMAARTRTGFKGQRQVLVFSDEFNQDGRSFYAGDDPYWEAVDLWAGGTGDYEWYSPAAVTTANGALVITASAFPNHNLNFQSGEVQSWNKFCFTGGYIEVAVTLPGSPRVAGWWPAVWTMGNLGRANFGATTQGTWPYAYDACDLGTLVNQTTADGLGPAAALTSGALTNFNDKYNTQSLSYLPGQKLSRCTCDGDDHPGPKHSDGTYVGRSAPELDVFEAQVDSGQGLGTVSMSGQWAPFNYGYYLINTTGNEYEGQDPTWQLSSYRGNVNQQSASSIIQTNQQAYELSGNRFAVYGFEYKPGYVQDGAYVHWVNDGKPAWTLNAAALAADPRAQIAARPVPQEPMYIIMNLAISAGFGYIDWNNIQFPAQMKIDYVRVYQDADRINVGCDPPDYPTADYINRHLEAYTNPNLTIWGGTAEQGGYTADWPRNRLYPGGCTAPAQKQFGSAQRPAGRAPGGTAAATTAAAAAAAGDGTG